MVSGDIEDAKHQIAQLILASTFAAALAAVDAEKGSAVATPIAASVYEGSKQVKNGQGYPVCEVIGHKTEYDPADQEAKSATHEIGVYWTQIGDDELTITTQLERLVRATRDVCWNAGLEAIASAPVEVVTEEYGPLLPGRDGPFVKGSQTILRVRTYAL